MAFPASSLQAVSSRQEPCPFSRAPPAPSRPGLPRPARRVGGAVCSGRVSPNQVQTQPESPRALHPGRGPHSLICSGLSSWGGDGAAKEVSPASRGQWLRNKTKPPLQSWESTLSRMAKILPTPPPTTPRTSQHCPSAAQGSSARAAGSPGLWRSKAQGAELRWARGPRRPYPPQGWGQPSCLQLPQSLTVNDLPGSLSKINKNVLKFNFKNLALIIYIECFSSSKRPVWEFLPQERTLGKAAKLPWWQRVRVGKGR